MKLLLLLMLLLLQLINWRERIGCLCAWIFWWLRCLLRVVCVCVCVCVCVIHPPTFFLQLCACLLCVLLMVTKLTKTKPWCVADGYKTHKNKTMTIHVKDWVAWWIVITQCLNSHTLFVHSNFYITFFFGFSSVFWCFRMPSSSKPIHWKDMTIPFII
jgi:hypothetical protein